MILEIDEGKGLVKTYWKNIRSRVAKVEPTFAKIVDELTPGNDFPLYLAYYPYGESVCGTEHPFYPKHDGGVFRLNDVEPSHELIPHLQYGDDSAPLSLVLEKHLEFFIDFKDQRMTIPVSIENPGDFYPLNRLLCTGNNRFYSPNGVLDLIAGARSCLMLPHIGSALPHGNLKRDFNIKTAVPKTLYDHWSVFQEIANSPLIENDWRTCILLFSQKWVDMIQYDKAWASLLLYMYQRAWRKFEYNRNRIRYDTIFSVIQKQRNLRPNPYLVDTARHLFATALGAAPGYVPAMDDSLLPWSVLQKAYTDSYGLTKNAPIIMQPSSFQLEQDRHPIYYSLQYPSTLVFAPKARKAASTLFEMHELEHIMHIFSEKLAKNNSMSAGTILNHAANVIKFNYFHTEPDRHHIVRPTREIAELDQRFTVLSKENTAFPVDAPFVRGCISMQVIP